MNRKGIVIYKYSHSAIASGSHTQNLKTMKNLKAYFPVLIILLMLTVSSCEVIGDIFKAGMWTAVIIIVLLVLIVMWVIRKFTGRS